MGLAIDITKRPRELALCLVGFAVVTVDSPSSPLVIISWGIFFGRFQGCRGWATGTGYRAESWMTIPVTGGVEAQLRLSGKGRGGWAEGARARGFSDLQVVSAREELEENRQIRIHETLQGHAI